MKTNIFRTIFRVLGTVLVGAVALTFAACGGGAGGGGDPGDPGDPGSGTLPGWTAVTDSTFGTDLYDAIKAIAYGITSEGSGMFVAVGEGFNQTDGYYGKMAASADGETWTAVDVSGVFVADANSFSGINAIAYGITSSGSGTFVAGSGSGIMAYSTDGETWTAADVSHIFDTDEYGIIKGINTIAYGGAAGQELFVAGGDMGTIATSPDGEIWTAVANSPFVANSYGYVSGINAIAYGITSSGSGIFIAGDEEGHMATSTNGTTWTAATNNPLLVIGGGDGGGVGAIAYGITSEGSGMFVAGEGGAEVRIAYSSNGTTWATVDVWSTFKIIYSIAYGIISPGNGTFVTVGAGSGMATSTNGITWTAVADTDNPFIFQEGEVTHYPNIFAIAYGNGKFVAGGDYGKMACWQLGSKTPKAADYTISGTGIFTYDGNGKFVNITKKDNSKSAGNVTVYYEGTNGTTYPKSDTGPWTVGIYTVTFDVAAAAGWNAASGLKAGTITINKAGGGSIGSLYEQFKTYNSITIQEASSSNWEQTVEYAISMASDGTGLSAWQPAPVFTGLDANTMYYVYARSAESGNYNAGTPSVSMAITTRDYVEVTDFAYYWVNEQDELAITDFSGTGAITLSPGQTLTVTAQGAGYTNQRWHLNGVDTGEIGNSYAFSTTITGNYTLGLFVQKGGKYYNANFAITVQ